MKHKKLKHIDFTAIIEKANHSIFMNPDKSNTNYCRTTSGVIQPFMQKDL